MSILVLLILASLVLAAAFLAAFIWAVRSGQFEDTYTPSMRILAEDTTVRKPSLNSPIKSKSPNHD